MAKAAGGYPTDKPVWGGSALAIIPSPALTLSTAANAVGDFMVPFACRIMKVYLNVTTAGNTNPTLLTVGRLGDTDRFVDDYSIAASTTGFFDITDEATVVATEVAQGDVIVFSTNGGAASTGIAYCTLICSPNV